MLSVSIIEVMIARNLLLISEAKFMHHSYNSIDPRYAFKFQLRNNGERFSLASLLLSPLGFGFHLYASFQIVVAAS
jgi:hypothetical protein